jgi:hypothetical protein
MTPSSASGPATATPPSSPPPTTSRTAPSSTAFSTSSPDTSVPGTGQTIQPHHHPSAPCLALPTAHPRHPQRVPSCHFEQSLRSKESFHSPDQPPSPLQRFLPPVEMTKARPVGNDKPTPPVIPSVLLRTSPSVVFGARNLTTHSTNHPHHSQRVPSCHSERSLRSEESFDSPHQPPPPLKRFLPPVKMTWRSYCGIAKLLPNVIPSATRNLTTCISDWSLLPERFLPAVEMTWRS